jgi:hypothetical protein
MYTCQKCGSKNINKIFRRANEIFIGTIVNNISTEFVNRSICRFEVLKDCIINNCRECQYSWDCAPLDSDTSIDKLKKLNNKLFLAYIDELLINIESDKSKELLEGVRPLLQKLLNIIELKSINRN